MIVLHLGPGPSTCHICESACENLLLRIFCGFLGKIAKLNFLSTLKILTFCGALSKFTKDFFVDFDLLKLFTAPVLRKFLPFFQNLENQIWQFLRYFKNLNLKPNISKTSFRFNLGLFSLTDRSLLHKHDFLAS